MSSALTFASVLTLTFQFLIFAYVYSSHRVRFFYYLLLAWGLMSVSKGLHVARTFLPEWDVLSALLNAAFLVATLLVLAGGLALRSDYRISKRALLISGLGALVAAGFGDLSDASVTARSTAGFVTGGILILGGLQFWPRRGQPRYRGTRFLAGALALWGVHRIVSPFFNPAPETGGYLTIHATFMFCYFLATFAIIIMVLDRARSETACFVVKHGRRESAEDRHGITRRPRQLAPAESGRIHGAECRLAPAAYSSVRKDIHLAVLLSRIASRR